MNEDFKWTDELVKEMIYQKCAIPEQFYGNVQNMVDEFKQSKQKPLDTKKWEIVKFKVGNEEWIRENKEREYFNVNFRSRFERIHESVIPKDIGITSVRRLS